MKLWVINIIYREGFWITSIPQKHPISPQRCRVTSEMKREGFMLEVFSFAENIWWHLFKWLELYMEIGNVCLAVACWKHWRHHGGFPLSENLGKTRATFAVVSFHSMYNATTTCMALHLYCKRGDAICIICGATAVTGEPLIHSLQFWCPCSSTYSKVDFRYHFQMLWNKV